MSNVQGDVVNNVKAKNELLTLHSTIRKPMTTDVTLTLPQHLYERAEIWSKRTGKSISDILTQVIDESLAPLNQASRAADWSDGEVINAAGLRMNAAADSRLSELLQSQQRGELCESGRAELRQLMLHYQEGLLLKAEGIREAVRRGLREPVKP